MPEPGPRLDSLHESLAAAIAAAASSLDGGGTALDAVQAAVVVLEDAPGFNAGRGSVATVAGTVEMDAGIMCGRTLRAGAVALVSAARNPVTVARLVLDDSPHVLVAGTGADELARERGAKLEPPGYFLAATPAAPEAGEVTEATGLGTVGAVVSDGRGNVAAATSTGGVRGQLPGRIGDSPIVGAGVYAENRSCAVSCTGTGEEIMRTMLAHRIARTAEAGGGPAAACRREIEGALAAVGGSGGAIALDAHGDLGMCFNTPVMHRAWKRGDAPVEVAST